MLPMAARSSSSRKTLLAKLTFIRGNVQCTPQYWRNAYHEFKAANFFHSYVKNREISIFHTGSLAEYHEPHLRQLLCKYKRKLTGSDPADCDRILTDDTAFSQAVNDYRQIVTHYLATKMELWMALFMAPIYGVSEANLAYEFAKSRGVIHYHTPCTIDSDVMDEISAVMSRTADKVVAAQKIIDGFINTWYRELPRSEDFPVDPSTVYNQTGKELRRKYIAHLDHQPYTEHWNEYMRSLEEALEYCAFHLQPIMEGKFGIGAMHTGDAPKDWLRPGANPVAKLNYRFTHQDMQTSAEVVQRAELKKPKFQRESNLYQRKSNMCNHCLCHQCSAYCSRITQFSRLFDPTKDAGAEEKRCFKDKDGQQMVRCDKCECRFQYGELLQFDPSGEGNLTRGMERIDKPYVAPDKNGLIRYYGRRNHPRMVQCPHGAFYYGANNDSQFPLVNATGPETLSKLGPLGYEQFCNCLSAAGLPGLEHYNGANLLEAYCTGYLCKGNENPREWKDAQQLITEKYCQHQANELKSFRNLIAKHMNEIVRHLKISKDQALYTNGDGVMKRLTMGNHLKASVNPSIEPDELGAQEIAAADGQDGNERRSRSQKSFNWKIALKFYKDRPATPELEDKNLYMYLVDYWDDKKQHVPQIYGYYNRASWPLREDFSKYTLALFKPWRNSIDDNKHPDDGTFRTTLLEFMWSVKHFPGQILAEILRAKRGEQGVDYGEVDVDHGGEGGSPTDERTNEANEEAIAVNPATAGQVPEDGEAFVDMRESLIAQMDKRVPPGYDWSDGYQPELSTALKDYAKQFYRDRARRTLMDDADDPDLQLFDETVNQAHNYRTPGQQLLICHHLLCHKQLMEYERANDKTGLTRPPAQRILVEGLPGVGKSWVINTLRNTVRLLHGTKHADMASTPTGCSASLVDGSTHFRALSVPVGKALNKAPTNSAESNRDRIKEARVRMSRIIAWFQDEHSMTGRNMWGWLRHRAEEYRRPKQVIDDSGAHEGNLNNLTSESDGDLPPEVYNRPWGGIPFIYSSGDCHQIAPVGAKAFYSTEPGSGSTADGLGKVVVSDFMNPPNSEDEEFNAFMLRDVVRQDDPFFLGFLERLRNGMLTDADVDWLASKCLDSLTPEERESFKGAISLVPTWRQAHEIIYRYLQDDLTTPIAVLRAHKSTIKVSGRNCLVQNKMMPGVSALCVGAKVMLTHNYIVEHHLMNGAVGECKGIYYSHPDGPAMEEPNFNEYVVCEFPKCTIPDAETLVPGKPGTWVPIAVETLQCEDRCCECRMIPLTVCIALTIHKAQGMTIGLGEFFEKVIVYLPDASQANKSPGLEVVELSRAKRVQDFAIGNPTSSLDRASIRKIGTGRAYEARRRFQDEVLRLSDATKERTIAAITAQDPHENKTYEGGCNYLLGWLLQELSNSSEQDSNSDDDDGSSEAESNDGSGQTVQQATNEPSPSVLPSTQAAAATAAAILNNNSSEYDSDSSKDEETMMKTLAMMMMVKDKTGDSE
ncbi:hypothetical protein ACHAWF_018133 [Thalassiosira exigua]